MGALDVMEIMCAAPEELRWDSVGCKGGSEFGEVDRQALPGAASSGIFLIRGSMVWMRGDILSRAEGQRLFSIDFGVSQLIALALPGEFECT